MTFKYQESFADELYTFWISGKDTHVRNTISQLKNKAQAAYISGLVVYLLARDRSLADASEFVKFMHPNNAYENPSCSKKP